ncbi:MAG: hypothetical protein GY943_03125 [Chloroflexi bacterium]|nr:hypothetical protein [Chloroflexota bacterium]
MNLPTIFEWIDRLNSWRGLPAVVIVLITAVLITAAFDWRLSLFALMVQYLFTGLLFVDLLDPRLAVVKILVGLFVCLMLYFTGRQVNWGGLPPDITRDEVRQIQPPSNIRIGSREIPFNAPVRAVFVGVIGLILFFVAQMPTLQLPVLPDGAGGANTAVFILAIIGLLGLVLSTDPFQAGLGLLMFVAGFELYYSGLEQSIPLLAGLAAANFGIVLVISYLTQARFSYTSLLD